ncbi:MAG: hypothetical protein EOP11_07900 [Proteobacteria bacterium]|nr:MAG: hypothetical protein EOP11_07900 [Pseudomonadota bacterium]
MNTILLSALMLATSAFAGSATKYEKRVAAAKISIIEAINIAQKEKAGTAVSAELDDKRGATIYEVEVLSGGKLFEIKLDAASGKVLETKED